MKHSFKNGITYTVKCYQLVFLFFSILPVPSNTLYSKTNEPLYSDPFDLGSGGAVLTRSTQSGMLASNPALLPYGGKMFRWVGLRTSLYPGKDSIDTATSFTNQVQGKGNDEEENATDSFLDKAFDTPLHFGVSSVLSFVTNHFGFAAFSSTQPDVRAWQKVDPYKGAGTPTIVLQTETYAGALASFASRSPWEWLSFGVTGKYVFAEETLINVEITDQESIAEAQKELTKLQSPLSLGKGVGFDIGSLFFYQTDYLDLRFAATAVNFGGTKLEGEGSLKELKQHYNIGTGFTLHTDEDALHFSADYRDIGNAYGDPIHKRLYVGTKFVFGEFLGLAAGYYHGNPSYGVELDAWLLRLSAALYTIEYTDSPGVDRRPIYVVSFATGSYF